MYNRQAGFRRRLILVLVLAVGAAGAGTWVHTWNARRQREIAMLRSRAMADYNAGRYQQAVYELGEYLDRSKSQDTDSQAMFAYGTSRLKVPMPQAQQAVEGIQIFQRYLHTPGAQGAQRQAARRALLGLYIKAWYNAEAIRLADEFLADNPKDVEALQCKIHALDNQRRELEALSVSRDLNRIAPDDLWGQRATLYFMGQLRMPGQSMIDHAQALVAAHPGDPRYEVVKAYACEMAGDKDQLRALLRSAASRKPPSAQFAIELASQLDQNELFTEADALLRRAAANNDDLGLARVLARRLWQDGALDEVLRRTAAQGAQLASGDADLLGCRALAFHDSGNALAANAIVEALAARSHDPTALDWAALLRLRFAAHPLAPLERAKTLRDLIVREDQDPLAHQMLAEAWDDLGETELALGELRRVAALAPSCATPHLVATRIFASTGRYNFALDTALAARERAPQNAQAQIAYAMALYRYDVAVGRSADYATALEQLRSVQTRWGDASTLPATVDLLARTGQRQAAMAALRADLARTPTLPADALLELISISEQQRLGEPDAIWKLACDAYGSSPGVILARAQALHASGHGTQASRLIEGKSAKRQTDPAWRVALARYREPTVAPADALREWEALAEAFPNDLGVQKAAMAAPSRVRDRAFWERTIERVKALTGDEGLEWRAERGRWLLNGPMGEKDKAEAVNLLTQVAHAAPSLPEPHRLLALALEATGNTTGAIAEWTAACQARPDDPLYATGLVRLLIASNRADEAARYLDKLASNPAVPFETRRWIAQQYASHGELPKAIALLKSLPPDMQRDALLCRMYQEAGQYDDAAAAYRALLSDAPASPDVQVDALAAAADFFASRGDLTDAATFMDRLAQLPLKPGELELARAHFAERFRSPEAAERQYVLATQAAADSSAAWLGLAGFYLRQQDFDSAASTAAQGLKSLPDDNALWAIQSHAALLDSLAKALASQPKSRDSVADSQSAWTDPSAVPVPAPDLRPLIDLLSRDPTQLEGCALLKDLAVAAKKKASPADMSDIAAALAEKHSALAPLQMQAARLCMRAGKLERAAQFASAAAGATPGDSAPYALLTQIDVAMRDWDRALEAAAQWRRLTPGSAIAPDLAAARIWLRQPRRNPAKAVALLAPYLLAPLEDGVERAVLREQGCALIALGRSDEAAHLLAPLAARSAAGRRVWLELCTEQPDAKSARAWIDRIAASAMKSPEDRLSLARAWCGVGERFENNQALESARQLAGALTRARKAPAEAWMLAGRCDARLHHFDDAIADYRGALAQDPNLPKAKNELARALCLRGRQEDLPEAQRLAKSALAAPDVPASFHNTLAQIEVREGNSAAATQAFRATLSKDPMNIEAMVGLARLLAQNPAGRGEARDLLARASRFVQVEPGVSRPIQQELDSARAALAASSLKSTQ